MKNGKLIKILIACLLLCMFACGCNDAKKEEKQAQTNTDAVKENKKVEFPSEYQAEDGIVSFKCSVLAPENPVLNATTAKAAEVDYFGLVEEYTRNRRLSEITVWDNEGNDTVLDGDNGIISHEDMGMYKYVQYLTEDDEYVSTGYNGFGYYVPGEEILEALLLGNEDDGYNGDLYLKDTDFPFATQEAVQGKLADIVQAYTNIEDIQQTLYCVDADTLNENRLFEIDDRTGEPVEPYTSASDGYYICGRQVLQGLPVYPREDGMIFEEYPGDAPILAYYTEEGFRELSIEGDRLFTFDTSGPELSLKGFDEIAQNVSDYYNSLITDNTYEVYQATLYNYVTHGSKVTPVWIFKTYERYPDGNWRCDQLDVNAVTGEVFTIYD